MICSSSDGTITISICAEPSGHIVYFCFNEDIDGGGGRAFGFGGEEVGSLATGNLPIGVPIIGDLTIVLVGVSVVGVHCEPVGLLSSHFSQFEYVGGLSPLLVQQRLSKGP